MFSVWPCFVRRSLDLSKNSLSSITAELLWHTASAVDLSENALTGPIPTPAPGIVPVTTFLNVSFNNFSGPLPIDTIESLPGGTMHAVFDLSCDYFDLSYAYKLQQYCDGQNDTCLYEAQYPNATCTARSAGVPLAPQGVVSLPGVASALVAWSAAAPGTPTVTSYTVSAVVPSVYHDSPGSNASCAAPCTNVTIAPLDPGTPYTFAVVAAGPGGSSDPSVPSNTVTPCAAPNQPPDPPSAVTVSPGVGSAALSWTPATQTPCWQGSIGGWNVTAVGSSAGGPSTSHWVLLSATARSWTLGNVSRTSGVSYTFTVSLCRQMGAASPHTHEQFCGRCGLCSCLSIS